MSSTYRVEVVHDDHGGRRVVLQRWERLDDDIVHDINASLGGAGAVLVRNSHGSGWVLTSGTYQSDVDPNIDDEHTYRLEVPAGA